jgi:alkaline phosphatase D
MRFHLSSAACLFFLLLVGCQHPPAAEPDKGAKVTITNTNNQTITRPIPSAFNMVPRGIDYSHAPETIAFSCCANQDAPQPLWNVIAKHEPDLFIFNGNVIYSSTPEQKPAAEQFKKLSQLQEYRKFRETFPVMAVWDDNDSGQSNSGADNPEKELYRKEFLKQFPYIKDSIGWNQGGLYHVKYIGGNTMSTGRRRKRIVKKEPLLQVIMLDARFFRSPLRKAGDQQNLLRAFEPWDEKDKSKTILGQEQWSWLEEQLSRPADLRLIVTPLQVIANQHGFEKWGDFPGERQRLFDLIKKAEAHNTILISGNRDFGAIAKIDLKGFGPLFDITAGSINRPVTLDETDPSYLGTPFKNENFGLAQIDWKKHRVRVEIRSLDDKVANSVDFKF